jgi:hypothetical protein
MSRYMMTRRIWQLYSDLEPIAISVIKCPKCHSNLGSPCFDLRKGYSGRKNKRPHKERVLKIVTLSDDLVKEFKSYNNVMG